MGQLSAEHCALSLGSDDLLANVRVNETLKLQLALNDDKNHVIEASKVEVGAIGFTVTSRLGDSAAHKCEVSAQPGTGHWYNLAVTCPTAGLHTMTLSVNGITLPTFPRDIDVHFSAHKCRLVEVPAAVYRNEGATATLEVSDAAGRDGEGIMPAEHVQGYIYPTSGSRPVEPNVRVEPELGTGRMKLSFTPAGTGQYCLMVNIGTRHSLPMQFVREQFHVDTATVELPANATVFLGQAAEARVRLVDGLGQPLPGLVDGGHGPLNAQLDKVRVPLHFSEPCLIMSLCRISNRLVSLN